MPWVRLDDRFPSHRKVALLSDRAFRLHVTALCWSSENLTEGKVLDTELRVIAHVRNTKAAAKELEDRQLWDRVDDGWVIHDFLEYNKTADEVRSERESNAARQQAWRDRKKEEKEAKAAAEKEAKTPPRNARRNGVTNGVSNSTPAPAPNPSTSFGSTGAAGAERRGLPDPLAELKQGIAQAGLQGISWTLRESQWEYTRQAVERVGVTAMVAFAVSSARLKGQPVGASAWVEDWKSLEATPESTDGVTYLPAARGSLGPQSRQQQETDEWADRAMARARARDAARQQESS